MGREGDAGDHGALSAGRLGYWQGSRTYTPCANHKPCPIREEARTHKPLSQHTSQQEENANVEENIGTGRQVAGLYSLATAGSATGRHW